MAKHLYSCLGFSVSFFEMGTAPLSKLSHRELKLPPTNQKINSKRSLKRKYSLKKKNCDSKSTKSKQENTTLLQHILCRDWQKVVTRASSHQIEVASIYRAEWYGVSWEVLPIHLACALQPPPQVVAALLSTKENKEVLAATPMIKSTKVDKVKTRHNCTDPLFKSQPTVEDKQLEPIPNRNFVSGFLMPLSTVQVDALEQENHYLSDSMRANNMTDTKDKHSSCDPSKSFRLSFKNRIFKENTGPLITTKSIELLKGFPWKNIRKSSVNNEPSNSFPGDSGRYKISERQESPPSTWQAYTPNNDTSFYVDDADYDDDDNDISRTSLDEFLQQEEAFLQLAPTGEITVAHLLPNDESCVYPPPPSHSNQSIGVPDPSRFRFHSKNQTLPIYPTQEARKDIKYQEARTDSFVPETSILNCTELLQDSKRLLPIHIACLYRASTDVIALLLDAYKMGSEESTFIGMLPIHIVCADITTDLPLVTSDGHVSEAYEEDESMDIVLKKLHLLIDANPESINMACKKNDLTPFEYFLERELAFGDHYEACLDILGHLPISTLSSSTSFDTVSELGTPTVVEQTIVEAPSDEVESNADSFPDGEIWNDTFMDPYSSECIPITIGYSDADFDMLGRELNTNPVKDNQEQSTIIHSLLIAREWGLCLNLLEHEPGQARGWQFGISVDYHSNTKDQLRKRLPMHTACSLNAPIELISALINIYPKALSSPDPYSGSLPLHLACQCPSNPTQESVIFSVLQQYPNASKATDWSGKLPLHLAVLCGSSLLIVNRLIQVYPEALWVRDGNERLPLDYARDRAVAIDDYTSNLVESPEDMFRFLQMATTEESFWELKVSLDDFMSQMKSNPLAQEVNTMVDNNYENSTSHVALVESLGVDKMCL